MSTCVQSFVCRAQSEERALRSANGRDELAERFLGGAMAGVGAWVVVMVALRTGLAENVRSPSCISFMSFVLTPGQARQFAADERQCHRRRVRPRPDASVHAVAGIFEAITQRLVCGAASASACAGAAAGSLAPHALFSPAVPLRVFLLVQAPTPLLEALMVLPAPLRCAAAAAPRQGAAANRALALLILGFFLLRQVGREHL